MSANKKKEVIVMDINDINERKIRILEAIIYDYIQTGDPVGSRTISKKYGLGVSSATIRNEMSDLEELGFILQPHASAGRIPSHKGYRLYVDNLMKTRTLSPEEEVLIGQAIRERIDNIELLLEETAKLVSILTNYATIASTTTVSKMKIKRLQLVLVDERTVACVMIFDTNIVRHEVIKTNRVVDYDLCHLLTNMLDELLKEKVITATNLEDMSIFIKEKLKGYSEIAEGIINAIEHVFEQEKQSNVFTRGVMNILHFQEFSDIDKAKKILELFEQKPYLIQLLENRKSDKINVMIGEENTLEPMKECSIITTSYSIGEYTLGNIGIIGPTRMNYAQVISVLEHISYYIKNMLGDKTDS